MEITKGVPLLLSLIFLIIFYKFLIPLSVFWICAKIFNRRFQAVFLMVSPNIICPSP